jgi:hypothetical protein
MRTMILMLCMAAGLGAQSRKFEDVHIWVSKNPASEGGRRDGILNFVADTKVLVTIINAEDQVAQAIPYASISKIEYNKDAAKRVTIYYRNPDGAERVARLNLHGGNHDEIIQAFGKAGLAITPVGK